MPPSPPTAADELHWRELQLAQRRNLEGSFLHLGIPESAQHEIWLRGYQAGGAAQYGESSRATGPAQFPQTEQQVKPEPAMPVPQVCYGFQSALRRLNLIVVRKRGSQRSDQANNKDVQ